MSVFNSISNKIMLGFAAILLLVVVTSGLMYRESVMILEQKEYFSQQALPALRDAEDAADNIGKLQLAAFELYSTSISSEDFVTKKTEFEDNLSQLIAKLRQLDFVQEIGLEQEMQQVWDEVTALQVIMNQEGSVDWDGARTQLSQIQNAVGLFNEKLDSVTHQARFLANEASDNITSEIRMLRGLIVFSVVAISLITALGFIFSRRVVVKPAASLSEEIKRIAANNDISQDVPVFSHDEIGFAATSMNTLLQTFRNGNLAIQQSAAEMLTSTKKLDDSAQLSDTQVLTFSEHISELLQKIDTLERSIEISTSRSNSASEMARTGAEQVRQGAKNVSATSNSIATLAKEVEHSAEMLLSLKNAGDKVGSVVKTIADIAEQTNLLALNAAIEAARAGESGRGFAVVADEVRTLASRTHESTHEINTILDTIVGSISSTVTTMDSNKAMANESVNLVEETVTSLGAIKDTVIALSNENHDLAGLAQDIRQDAVVMRSSINKIEQASKGVEDTSKETRAAAKELSDIAILLNTMAKRFKV
ncbi:methyl-accepting chemotaxis protein [Alteromonas sp. a30]|uniref:methyl-accepting chemotaxis protein n=1 Tax=Alteromonas sp. a30 TaxID=2730917 RepID=UPI00227DAF15|nr:methyl-accepting chemotaxis protein [Alteromonas sp. a30]MCY7297281.1 methyl-accepting chemotaxis protein [Alteromonas sp. a30]